MYNTDAIQRFAIDQLPSDQSIFFIAGSPTDGSPEIRSAWAWLRSPEGEFEHWAYNPVTGARRVDPAQGRRRGAPSPARTPIYRRLIAGLRALAAFALLFPLVGSPTSPPHSEISPHWSQISLSERPSGQHPVYVIPTPDPASDPAPNPAPASDPTPASVPDTTSTPAPAPHHVVWAWCWNIQDGVYHQYGCWWDTTTGGPA